MGRVLKITGWILAGTIILMGGLLAAVKRQSGTQYIEVHVHNGKGTQYERLVNEKIAVFSVGVGGYCSMHLSPRSEWVIVESEDCDSLPLDYESQLVAVHVTTGKQKIVSHRVGSEIFEGFSPDGEWLYFSHDPINNRYYADLYRYHMSTGEMQQVTSDPNFHENIMGWSTDGQWLYFKSEMDGSFSGKQLGIGRMRPDGSHMQLLISNDDPVTFADISPQGQWIVYFRRNLWGYPFYQDNRLYRMRPDGSDVRSILPIGLSHVAGVYTWSADGEWLIFHQFNGHDYDILKLHLADGHIETLVATSENEQLPFLPFGHDYPREVPALSPDGQWVYFTRLGDYKSDPQVAYCGKDGHDDVTDLFRIRLEGSEIQQIPTNGGSAIVNGWTPEGEWMIRSESYTSCQVFSQRYFTQPDGLDNRLIDPNISGWAKMPQRRWSSQALLGIAGISAIGLPLLNWFRRRLQRLISQYAVSR